MKLKTLTNKEAASLLGIAPRTWLRYRAKYKVPCSGYWGKWPLFTRGAILAMEKRRQSCMKALNSRCGKAGR